MAKRQQFSGSLQAWTLLLKFENVVPHGWISTVGQVKFLKKNQLVQIFFSCEYSNIQQKINDSVFDHISLVFLVVFLRPIAASVTSIPKCSTLEYLLYLYTRQQAEL